MKRTYNLGIMTVIGVCAFIIAVVTPEAVSAQSTDAMLTNYIRALNANMPPKNNPEAVAELFSEDGIQYHMFGEPPGGPHRDRQAIRDFFAGFENTWVDWTHIETSRMIQGNRAVWEGVAQGTHKETGKFVKVPAVFFIEFDDQGKVKEKRVYLNTHLIGEQVQ
jgi:ketosteroid isomerase-like protein